MVESQKPKPQKLLLLLGRIELDKPNDFKPPFLMIWTNFEVAIVIRAHLGYGGKLVTQVTAIDLMCPFHVRAWKAFERY
jgi:hypothetical protein